MSRLLLVDEVQATRDTLAEMLRTMEHTVEAHVDPESAREALIRDRFDAVFVASRGSTWKGDAVIAQIRVLPTPHPPVIWMDTSDHGVDGAAAVLKRPPRAADVSRALEEALGASGQVAGWATAEFLHRIAGPIEQYPPLRVIALAHRVKATGRINVVTDEGRHSVDLDGGRVVHASGFADILEFLGIKNAPDEDMNTVLGKAVAAGMAADTALKIAGQGLGKKLAELIEADGHVEFDGNARPPGQPLALPVTVPRMIAEGLRQARPVDKLRKVYTGLLAKAKVDVTVPKGVGFESLGLDPVAYRMLRKAQKVPYVELLIKAEEDDADARILALDLLNQLGYLTVRPDSVAESVEEDTDEITAARVIPNKKRKNRKKSQDPRVAELRNKRSELRDARPTEALGITDPKDVNRDAVSRRFREVSRAYHPDKFVGEPKAVRLLAEDCFSLLNAAQEQLMDQSNWPEAIARLEAAQEGRTYVSKRDKNQAKIAFAKGELHFRNRRWEEAYQDLAVSVKLDPEPWRHQSLYLQAAYWTEHKGAREVSEALDEIARKLLEQDEAKYAHPVSDILFNVGEIWMREEQENRALKFFERATKVNPKHTAALRRLWLKQVRDGGGKPTPPRPTTSPEKEKGGALAGVMGLFKRKK